MPFGAVRLKPGIQTEATATQNEAGYSFSQLGRFKAGLFQKLGGWQKFITAVVSGIPRALLAWQDLNQNGRLGVGTTTQLGVATGGAYTDISPQIYTTNPGDILVASDGSPILASDGSPIIISTAPNFSTMMTSNVVTIVDTQLAATVTTFDDITLLTPVSVGGLILVGTYAVNTILAANSYTILASSNAASTVNNGGAVPRYTTTSGSATVNVLLANHGLSVGQNFVDPTGTQLGGVTILGSYPVIAVTDANNFSIVASAQASSSTSTSMNGGGARIVYGITLGPLSSGTAYGFGPYGSGPYGGTGSAGTVQTGSAITAPTWTLDNWGQILVGCPQGNAIYYWDPSGSLTNATPIVNGPPYNAGVFVSARFQILVAFGSTPVPNGIGFVQDPLFVKWSDQGNFLTWTPTATNQAGGQRLYSGSKIIAGYGAPLNDYLWTDLDMWSMNYLGFPNIYGFTKVGENCGIAGPHAFVAQSSVIYWMGPANFFMSTGSGVQVMPCTVWDVVFQDLDTTNLSKVTAWSNTDFTEVWWYYPSISGGIGECDKYVKFNIVEQAWDFGPLQRSAAIDRSVLGPPIAATRSGIIYQHETGFDGDGSAISPVMITGFSYISEGEEYSFVDRIYPDAKFGTFAGSPNATLQVYVLATNFPGDTVTTFGPYTMTKATEFIPVRIRARQIAIQIQSSDLGSFWRLGLFRYRYSPDGRR